MIKQNSMDDFLKEQQDLSAVEKFSIAHDLKQLPAAQSLYKELIPKTTPGPGQQYAFEVNLDQCSGCKACITACHNENGLDEDEIWRSVGQIHGGTTQSPVIQHITTACHHCLDPACLNGCPVNAYEKDTATGIVKHLDDQCIGCQYCTFTCAYDVPKYHKKKGIVHKCDMCISRLNVGEAPACVRACPTAAIRVTLVDVQAVRNDPNHFVQIPDAPDSRYSLPTTRYLRKEKFPENMESNDSYTVTPEHSHSPLIVMLVLTQFSVGAFGAGLFLRHVLADPIRVKMISYHALMALVVGVMALGVSVFHLGRPLYAFRAVLGLRKSWLSREIVVFGLFAFFAACYALTIWPYFVERWMGHWEKNYLRQIQDVFAILTSATGLLGVLCSIMVYQVTRRPFWDHPMTAIKFYLTTAITGISSTLLVAVSVALSTGIDISSLMEALGKTGCEVLAILTAVKLLSEASLFGHLQERQWTSLKKTAFLMKETFPYVTFWRFLLGTLGGVILPLYLQSAYASLEIHTLIWIVVFICLLSLIAEFLERYLFFRAVVPLKMPGARMS